MDKNAQLKVGGQMAIALNDFKKCSNVLISDMYNCVREIQANKEMCSEIKKLLKNKNKL